MELKATSLGKRLAQHPYDRAEILNAGVKVSGDRHEYLIPFNQLLAIHCKRGLVWGELEFVLPEDKVVRLHGTEWSETQQFHRYPVTMPDTYAISRDSEQTPPDVRPAAARRQTSGEFRVPAPERVHG